jgi:hypothetical protein
MTLQPIPSGFPYVLYEENFVFFFISVAERKGVARGDRLSPSANGSSKKNVTLGKRLSAKLI